MHTGFVGCGYVVWFGQYTEIGISSFAFGLYPAYKHKRTELGLFRLNKMDDYTICGATIDSFKELFR